MESLTTPETHRQNKRGGLDFISWTTIRYRAWSCSSCVVVSLAIGVLAYISRT